MIKLLVAIAFLSTNFYVYNFMAQTPVIPQRVDFEEFPLELGAWQCERNEPLDRAVLDNLGAADTLLCDFRRADGALINFYVGYHETQVREEGGGSGQSAIHPPAHCLPGSGWDIIDTRTVPIDFDGLADPSPSAKRLIIAKGELRQLVFYWYQMQGRSVSEDWQKILYVGLDRAMRGRTDGALVRFTMPIDASSDGLEDAEQHFYEFARQAAPLLPRFVPN